MQLEERDFVKFLVINQGLAPKSVKSYIIRFRIFKRWIEENNFELTPQTVVNFLFEKKDEEELSNAAINTYRQALVHLDLCYKSHGLSHGFTEGTRNLPKIKPEIIILSKKELKNLLTTPLSYSNRNGVDCSNLDMQYLTLTEFLALTGCRFEEAASLQVRRLDISNGKALLVNTKNKDNRNVYFEGTIKETLTELIRNKKQDDYVFTGSTGNKVLAGTFNENIKLRAEKAGIKKRIYAHLLRHTFATHLLNAKVDIAIVSTLLGHKDIRTTYETYIHLADDTLQQAARKLPLMRNHVNPEEILKEAVQLVESLDLGSDKRFSYEVGQTKKSLEIHISF